MASEKKSNGKDLGTPIGIVAGLTIILIGIYLQKTSATFPQKLNWFISSSAVSYTHLTLPTKLEV